MRADLILSSLSSLGLRADAFRLKVFAGLTYPVFSSALQKLQDMDERRAARLGAGYGLLAEAELQVVPIIGKCLEGMKVAAESVDAKNVSAQHEPRGMRHGLMEGGSPEFLKPAAGSLPVLSQRTHRSSSNYTSQGLPARVTWNSKTSAKL